MKAIIVMFDSLNRKFLPPYGCDWIHAPNFERLAQRSVRFDNSYVGSLPCMPARRELHTGRYNLLHRGWGPVEPYDDSCPELLKNAGVYTHMISDHQHYWEDGGCTYHHRFNTWEIVRGHEGDKWKASVADPDIPEHHGQAWRQDQVNRAYIRTEADQPQTAVFELGLEFLAKNADADDWMLHLETFDPHEPFYVMEQYKALYPHHYDGPHFDWPSYAPVSESEQAVEHVRKQYAALLSMCDHNLGRVLDFMDEHDMWKDTMLIVNTDHGFLLGEHDWWAKCVQPFYEEVSHTPLFIWDPRLGVKGEARGALVQTIDLPATLLEYFNQPIPKDMQGAPLREVIKTDVPVREAALFGMHGGQLNVTDGRYVYMRAPANEANRPLYDYTLMPTHMRAMFSVDELRTATLAPPFGFTKDCPLLKVESRGFTGVASKAVLREKYGEEAVNGKFGEMNKTMLFDLQQDPDQLHPIDDPATERRMIELMVELMKQNDAPADQYERLGLEEFL